jgi:hypothetical protein
MSANGERRCVTCKGSGPFPPDRKTSNPKAWRRWEICQACYTARRKHAAKGTKVSKNAIRLERQRKHITDLAAKFKPKRGRPPSKHRDLTHINGALAEAAPKTLGATFRILADKLATSARLRGIHSIVINVDSRTVIVRTLTEDKVTL